MSACADDARTSKAAIGTINNASKRTANALREPDRINVDFGR
jgi:hypothetical protein